MLSATQATYQRRYFLVQVFLLTYLNLPSNYSSDTMPESKFLKVKCAKCRNEQIIFSKTAMQVKCLVCENVLAQPTGGIADIKGKIIEILDKE